MYPVSRSVIQCDKRQQGTATETKVSITNLRHFIALCFSTLYASGFTLPKSPNLGILYCMAFKNQNIFPEKSFKEHY